MDRLGKYEIRSVLGRGAMGTVYEGWDPHIERRVAIKTVRLPDSGDSYERELLDRFRQEAQAAGRMHHPNIVGVFDYAETDELAYIVMEFVDGRTLKSVLDENGPPSREDVARLMDGLLTGLEYSHGNQVIHRDIKPANVIMTAAGTVKIADFGIARIGGSGMTLAGTIMGTPAYMSPEQFRGTSIDGRTDVYSAGVVLFQLLTGKRPFEGSMATIMQSVLNDPTPSASDSHPGLPAALDDVVARAMARAPEDRFQTAGEMAQALQLAWRASPDAAPARPGGPAQSAAGLGTGLGDLLGDPDATVVRGSSPAADGPPARRALANAAPPAPATAARSRVPLLVAGVAVLLLAAGAGGFFVLRNGGEQVAATQPGPATAPATQPQVQASNLVAPAQPTPAAPPTVADTQATAVTKPTVLASPDPVPTPLPTPTQTQPSAPAQTASRPEATGPDPRLAMVQPPVTPTPTPQPTLPPSPSPSQPTTTPVSTPQPVTPSLATSPSVRPPAPTSPSVPPPTTTPATTQPVSVPVQPPAPPPRPAVQLAAAASALRATSCTAVSVEERPAGTLVLRGTALDQAVPTVRQAVAAASPDTPVISQVVPVSGPYCDLLDALRPFIPASAAAGPGVAMPGNRTSLIEDELIQPQATLPPWLAYLQLDYFASDGTMQPIHLSGPGSPYEASANAAFGKPKPPTFNGWEVAPPFGTDMVVAVASSVPLFSDKRPDGETAEDYVKALRPALEQASRGGARLAAFVLVLRTSPKPR